MLISKNTKIFLSVFSIALLIITIVTIWYTNTHRGNDESQVIVENVPKSAIQPSEISRIEEDTVQGVVLAEDVYDYNGISYEYKSDLVKNINATYPVISGLKDSSVEESINNQIRERIVKIFESNNFKSKADSSAYASANVVGNFSNVLSVKILVKFNENFSKNYGVSFNLESGSRIKLDELFTGNAPKKNIITSSAYKSFAIDYYTQEGLSNDFYSNIEADLLNFMIDYNDGKVTEFSFSPKVIEIYREGRTVSINMQDYGKYIAIYKRFLSSENIYKSTRDTAKKIPVFVERPSSIVDLYEKVNDVCIVDVIIYGENGDNNFTDKERDAIENYRKDLVGRMENIKSEKGIYYSNYVTVSRGRENNEEILIFTENEKYATSKENEFHDKIYNKILMEQRNVSADYKQESVISVLDRNMIVENSAQRKYSTKDAKELQEKKDDNRQEQEMEEGREEQQGHTIDQNNTTDFSQNQNTTNTTNEVNTPPIEEVEENITTQVFF